MLTGFKWWFHGGFIHQKLLSLTHWKGSSYTWKRFEFGTFHHPLALTYRLVWCHFTTHPNIAENPGKATHQFPGTLQAVLLPEALATRMPAAVIMGKLMKVSWSEISSSKKPQHFQGRGYEDVWTVKTLPKKICTGCSLNVL